MKKHKKIIYPSFERYLEQELKNKSFKQAYKKENQKLEIAYQIFQLRKKKKISQVELAKKIGSSQSDVARMETGQQNFSVNTLEKLARAFNCDFKIIFTK